MDNLINVKFSEINLNDTFFDSLKDSDIVGNEAFVYMENDRILDFFYLKDETEPLILDEETLPCIRRLRHLQHFFEKYGFNNVGTKLNPNGRSEVVLLRNMITTEFENPIKNFPFVKRNTGNKYMLSI